MIAREARLGRQTEDTADAGSLEEGRYLASGQVSPQQRFQRIGLTDPTRFRLQEAGCWRVELACMARKESLLQFLSL